MVTFTIAQQYDPAKAVAYLARFGITATATTVPDGIEVSVDDAEADEALGIIGSYQPLPDAYETHRQHVVDFRDAVRAGTDGSITLAQTRHVVADLIDGVFLAYKRLEDG